MSVRRTLVGANGGVPEYADPKTPRSRRTLTLPPDAVAALQRQRDRQTWERQRLGATYTDRGLVFGIGLRTPLRARNVVRAFKAALNRAGLPSTYTIHGPRHAAAPLMLVAGVSAKTAADRLGHHSAAFTLDRYTHAVQSLDEDAAAKLQSVIHRASRG